MTIDRTKYFYFLESETEALQSAKEKQTINTLFNKYNIEQFSTVENCTNVPNNIFQYLYTEHSICFEKTYNDKSTRLTLDFENNLKYHFKQQYSIKKEPFAKALGMQKNRNIKILDLTLGTAKDALLAISFGATVIGIEQHIVPSVLIEGELLSLKKTETTSSTEQHLKKLLKEHFFFIHGNSLDDINKLKKLIIENSPVNNISEIDVVYIDPMYAYDKKRKSAPRKEMQIFHNLLENEISTSNELQLLERALALEIKRVVVKRPIKLPPLTFNNKVSSMSYSGKSTRYDVYI